METIVDIYGLAAVLKASHHTLKKNWRKLPHFFIGDGHNLKGARFDIYEVIQFLKEVHHVSMERYQTKNMGSKIYVQQQTAQKGRLQDKVKGTDMGGNKTRRIEKPTGTGSDPFNLLAGIN